MSGPTYRLTKTWKAYIVENDDTFTPLGFETKYNAENGTVGRWEIRSYVDNDDPLAWNGDWIKCVGNENDVSSKNVEHYLDFMAMEYDLKVLRCCYTSREVVTRRPTSDIIDNDLPRWFDPVLSD